MWLHSFGKDRMAASSRETAYDSWGSPGVAPVTLQQSETARGNSDPLAQSAVSIPADFLPTSTMEFSKFRDTGELSDVAVIVEGKEFKLHKFPLYIKSDFFRALARSTRGDKDRVELSEFPGGSDTFGDVANYCYNVKINITKENVCRLRCAAEFLQMHTPGNLVALTDRYLQDTLTSAKLGHRFETIIDLVLQCGSLGAIAEQAGVVDKCINAIIDCWLISTKFTRRYTGDIRLPSETETIERLCHFPLSWYKQLCVAARDKSVKPALLAALVQTYISDAVDRKQGKKKPKEAVSSAKDAKQGPKDVEKETPEESPEENGEEDAQGEGADKLENGEVESEEAESEAKEEEEAGTEDDESTHDPDEDLDIGEVMDALLLEIPTDHPLLTESFSRKWVADMLRIAEAVGCQSQEVLLKLSSKMLHQFSREDLSDLSPEILSQIVAEGCRDNQANPDDICRVLDDYLMDQADKENLTVDTFQTLVDAVPKDSRASHDMLFQVLETLLTSERIPVEEEKKQELLKTVDYARLSESTLQRAYDSGLVPGAYVTRAALGLCSKLRGDLNSAKGIIRDQEQRLERFGLTPGAGTTWLRSMESGSAAKRRQRPAECAGGDGEYEQGFESSSPVKSGSRGGATPTLASDLELKIALDSLDRSLDRSVETIGMTDAAPTPTTRSSTTNYGSYYRDEGSDPYRHEPKPYTSTYTWSASRPYNKYSKT